MFDLDNRTGTYSIREESKVPPTLMPTVWC